MNAGMIGQLLKSMGVDPEQMTQAFAGVQGAFKTMIENQKVLNEQMKIIRRQNDDILQRQDQIMARVSLLERTPENGPDK